MNSEIESSLTLLKSVEKLVQATSVYKNEDNEEIFLQLKRERQENSNLHEETETLFHESLDRLMKLSSIAGSKVQYELSLNNLYNLLLRTRKQEEEEAFIFPTVSTEEFALEQITFEVSDQMDDDKDSEDDILIKGEEIKKSKKKRQRLDNSTKEFLEKVFEKNKQPNRRERELIAEKHGVSLSQIRVWFTNKRMRKKEPKLKAKSSSNST